jgi:hypothetical protein
MTPSSTRLWTTPTAHRTSATRVKPNVAVGDGGARDQRRRVADVRPAAIARTPARDCGSARALGGSSVLGSKARR